MTCVFLLLLVDRLAIDPMIEDFACRKYGGRKSGWLWYDLFEIRIKRNAFLRLILKERGTKNVKLKQKVEKAIFKNFGCIRKSEKRGVARILTCILLATFICI